MRANPRIAIVARLVYPYATGGAEIHTYYVAKELAKSNQVILISEGLSSLQFQGHFVHLNINTVSFPFFSSVSFISHASVRLLSRAREIDIVHAQVALSPIVVGVSAKMTLNKPLVITCHGSEVRLQKNFFVKIIQRLAFAIADRITVVSCEIKGTLVSRYHVSPFKIDVVPNGYEETLFRDYSKNHERIIFDIVYVGRLSYPKDPLTLLHAFEKVHKALPHVHLHFIGDGPLSSSLKHFCVDHKLLQYVHFLGKVPHRRTLEIVAQSTVFVLSSHEEGLPTSLIEAMALRKPIVATGVGGIPEIVKNGVNGVLVPSKSPIRMATALIKLLTDSELRTALGSAASESIKEYTWSNIAKKYEFVYHQVLLSKVRSFKNG